MLSGNKILLKRSNDSGRTPVLSSLDLGELGLNTIDGRIFAKTINGSVSSIVSFLNSDDYPYTLNHYYSSVNFNYGNNTVSQIYASVLGGYNNDISGGGSSVINGEDNDIAGDFSLIGSGLKNKINASGDYSFIAAGSGNLINHSNVFTLGSNITSHSSGFTYVNNLSVQGELYGNFQIDASDIVSGTLDAARLPVFNGDITTTISNTGSVSAKVVAIQGSPISIQSPSNGQTLQWNGTAWTPGTIPPGGSGGGGLVYFLNQALSGESPTQNLPLSAQLGRTGLLNQTTLTSPHLSQASYTLIAGFVTDVLDPNLDSIPGGIWDFNVWGYSNANVNNPTVIQALVYKYNNVDAPTLLSTSNDTTLTDSGLLIQHAMACLVPQTELSATDRIYIEIRGKASASNKHVTLGFGNSTPSHIHTTLPSVGGSGLVKVIDGVTQSPASLLVNSDVAANAAIDQSKINGLTDVASKANSVYTTVQSNSSSVWNYQGTDIKALTGDWINGNLAYTTIQSNSAAWNLDNSTDTEVRSLTSNWNSTYSTLSSLSSIWDNTTSTVQSQSATWGTSSNTTLISAVTSDVEVGGIEIAQIVPQNTSFQQFVETLLTKIYYPTITAPSATMSSSIGTNVEAGTEGITLTVNLNRGAITGKTVASIWDPNTLQDYRSGTATQYIILGVNNGTTSAYTSATAIIQEGTNTFNGSVTYATGPQPVDSKGQNYLSPLASNTIAVSTPVYGRRKAFYGVDNTSANSSDIRSLAGSLLNPSNGSTFTISIPIGTVNVVFAYPSSLRNVNSVLYQEGFDADVKANFTQTTVSVEGANGYSATTYKVYKYTPVAAFTQAATYNVTI